MKILLLIPYSPLQSAFGGALRIRNILQILSERYDVTVAGFGSNTDEEMLIRQFPQLTGRVHLVNKPEHSIYRRWMLLRSLFSSHSHWYYMTRSKELQVLIDDLTEKVPFDIIQSEFPVMAMFNVKGNGLRILDAHNVEFHNFKRMSKIRNLFLSVYYRLEYRKFFKEEMEAASAQHAIFTTSRDDLELFNRYLPHIPKFVIPNGVDLEKNAHLSNTKTDPASIVFVGMMRYTPNHDAMSWFLDEIFPLILKKVPQCKVYIVGKDPHRSITSRASENVIVTGYLNEIRPVVQQSEVYIVPLRMGGGTRLKILEALALKKPLVTTSIGCEGLDIFHNYNALVADTAETFAEAVIELLNNKSLQQTLAENGYHTISAKYSWTVVGEQLHQTINKITGNQPVSYDAEAPSGVNRAEILQPR